LGIRSKKSIMFVPTEIKDGMCTYCYDGLLCYDRYRNKVYCSKCLKQVNIKGIEKCEKNKG